ncbi:hypothetical protein [Paraburkholderia terrae]|nr:hypothetical protein [Paraburkholderia terrae]
MDDAASTVQLPAPDGRRRRRIVDTALESPHDIVQPEPAAFESDQCRVDARSVVVLEEEG